MEKIKQEMKRELETLVEQGQGLTAHQDLLSRVNEYQSWYSKALPIIRILLPERIEEFIKLYRDEKRASIQWGTFTIEDFFLGKIRTSHDDPQEIAKKNLSCQVAIFQSAQTRIDYLLNNIEGILQADLFDSELDAARELHDKGHLRAAGVVAGVVLEKHLANVCSVHGVATTKRQPGISDYNEYLKNSVIIDVPAWRFNQRLGDIRNYCGHNKEREPTAEEVLELINGVDKVIKTIS